MFAEHSPSACSTRQVGAGAERSRERWGQLASMLRQARIFACRYPVLSHGRNLRRLARGPLAVAPFVNKVEAMGTALEAEIESVGFRSLPPACLDETLAPEQAVLTRFVGSRMMRGKIARTGERWTWHFVLDTETPHEGCGGEAADYEHARAALLERLSILHVAVVSRTSLGRNIRSAP